MRTPIIVALALVSATAFADEPLTVIDGYSPKTNRVEWIPLEGEQGISRIDFYHRVGRDDLADEVHAHLVRAAVASVGSLAAAGFTMYEAIEANQNPNLGMCFGQTTIDGTQACWTQARATADAENSKHVMPAVIGGAASVGLLIYAIYELSSAPSLTDAAAHELAARYNATHVAPYASPDGAGVSVGGHF
jgi:hypothetical protein